MSINKHYLMSKMKSSGTAYLCWFILGCHYAYLGKWGWQILYWITFGGLGIWAIIDLFTIPSKVNSYNFKIARQIDQIERQEQEFAFERNASMLHTLSNSNQNKYLD